MGGSTAWTWYCPAGNRRVAAIIGHNWSVFFALGGRGIFTSLGVILILSPILGLVLLVLAYLFAPFRQLSLGVIIALIVLPILSWFFSQPLGINERLPITLGYIAILLIAVFRRLTAPRTSVSASVPAGELIINRLLFDRDIRDRETWISRTNTEMSSAEEPLKQKEQGKS